MYFRGETNFDAETDYIRDLEEQLQEIESHYYEALRQNCPKLKGYAIDTPFSPDTSAVSVELLFYMEKTEAWEEHL